MMSTTTYFIFLSTVLALTWAAKSAKQKKVKVTIDAAYTSQSMLYLVADGQVMYVNKKTKKESIHSKITEPQKLTKLGIEAAYTSVKSVDFIVNFYGKQSGLCVEYTGKKKVKKIKYSKDNGSFLKNGDPDAAAKKGGKVYFFKGCKMAVMKKDNSWGKAQKVKSHGLPCHVDAAWNDGEAMIVLKGDQIWRWNKDGTVNDPKPFHKEYKLTSWTLKPSTDTA